MRLRAVLMIAVAGLGTACGGGMANGVAMLTLSSSSWQPLPQPPRFSYQALNIPRASVALPAVFVGAQRSLSPGCFSPQQHGTPSPIGTDLAASVQREKDFEAQFKVSFEAAAIEAGLEADVAKLLVDRWTTRLVGIKAVEVDASLARANFDNEVCRAVDLRWFEAERQVAIGAIKVDSLVVEMGSLASSEQRVKVAAAIQRLGTSVGFNLARSALEDETLTYSATNVFVGVTTTGLGARRCGGNIQTRVRVSHSLRLGGCDGDVDAILSRPTDTRYTLDVQVPAEGESTKPFNIGANAVFKQPLGSIRLVTGNLVVNNRRDDWEEVTLTVHVLQVGLLGGDAPGF